MFGPHPIHLAVSRGVLSEVQSILTEDPSLIELRGNWYYTPLLKAAREGHAAIVEWLIEYGGADIEAQDYLGHDALYLSSRDGHLAVVSILLNKGADVNKADNDGYSPLMMAAWEGHVGVVKRLVSQEGIDLDLQDKHHGSTALWYASGSFKANNREQLVRLLLRAGADPWIASHDGRTPLDRAREQDRDVGCIRLLETALVTRLLHRARAINDARHAINKVARETEGMDEEERKRKMIAAAPACLKGRVERSETLPQVEVIQAPRNADEEEEKLAAAVERVVMDGQLPDDLFVEFTAMWW